MATSLGTNDRPAVKRQQFNGQITGDVTSQPNSDVLGPSVNRKKAKRRAKQAAKQAASVPDQDLDENDYVNGSESYSRGNAQQPHNYIDSGFHQNLEYNDAYPHTGADVDIVYSDEEEEYPYDSKDYVVNGEQFASNASRSRKGKKKKTGSGAGYDPAGVSSSMRGAIPGEFGRPRPTNKISPRAISDDALRTVQRGINSNIWNTSSQDERLRIKEYWLSLGEDERKALVKIEKNDVLKKMKDQQKHSCSCTVCGRKRVAIEEELEVLYDAYYRELEDYANVSQQLPESGNPILPPSNQRYNNPADLHTTNGFVRNAQSRRPVKGRIQELPDDEEDDDDEEELDGDELDPEDYSDDEYDDQDYSDEEPDDLPPVANEFFAFGKSLTVKGGILTVADDLLKNDGQKFIDMMEQLAERRMQREEAYYNPYTGHPSAPAPHSHASHGHLPPDEEEYDEEDEEEYNSQDEDYDDDDEVDAMTESQRMDEGRRMFQIFAARMFEQRVLTAYREKRAMERQQAFLRDLEEEEKEKAEATSKNAAKKAKQRQKEKAKKEALKEEKAKKDADKAAMEAAEEQRKQEEKRKRDEENRKREEERKRKIEEGRRAQEEEKARKKAEDRAREEARKDKEKKAREKKEKEENARRDREIKERELKLQQQKEEKLRQAQARLEKEAQEQKLKAEQEAQAAKSLQPPEPTQPVTQPAEPIKRATLQAVVALPPTLKTKPSYSSIESPQTKVATPALPKPPTPVRVKETSGLTSLSSAPLTPEPTPRMKQTTPPKVSSMPGLNPSSGLPPMRAPSQPTPISNTPHMSPMHTLVPPPGMIMQHQAGLSMSGPQMSPNGFPNGMLPGMVNRIPQGHQISAYPQHFSQPMGPPHRPFFHAPIGPSATSINAPQALQTMRPYIQEPAMGATQQMSMPHPMPLQQPFALQRDNSVLQHSRQGSLAYDGTSPEPTIAHPVTQPISRPDPIKRPASTKLQKAVGEPLKTDVDEISTRLGSSALLDDSDEPLPTPPINLRRTSAQQGMGLSNPATSSLLSSPFDHNPTPFGIGSSNTITDSWRSTSSQYGGSSTSGWGTTPSGTGWGSSGGGFSSMPMPLQHRSSIPRPVTMRLLTCQACQTLARQSNGIDGTGYHDFNDIVRLAAESARQLQEPQVNPHEIRNILDTEGDSHNGGGSFVVADDAIRARTLVKWVPSISEQGAGGGRPGIGLGEIGSPFPVNNALTLGGLGAGRF